MTLLREVALGLEVALLVVFALVVASTLLTQRRKGTRPTAYTQDGAQRGRGRPRPV